MKNISDMKLNYAGCSKHTGYPRKDGLRKCLGLLVISAAILMFILSLPMFMPGLFSSECFAYSESPGVGAGDRSDNRADRVINVRTFYTSCWNNREVGSTNVSGDLYDGDSYTMGLQLCDQHRLEVYQVTEISSGLHNQVPVGFDEIVCTSSNKSILEIDSNGNFTLHKDGNALLTIFFPGDENYKDCTIYLPVVVYKENGFIEDYVDYCCWGFENGHNITVSTADGPQQLTVRLKPGAHVTYKSEDSDIAYVNENGLVTPVSPGSTTIYTVCDEGDHGQFFARTVENYITVTGSDMQVDQIIEGSLEPVTIECDETFTLNLSAMTALSYSSSDTNVATVADDGTITGVSSGTAVITVTAEGNSSYKPASAEVNVTVTEKGSGDSGAGSVSGDGTGTDPDTDTDTGTGTGSDTGTSSGSGSNNGTSTGTGSDTGNVNGSGSGNGTGTDTDTGTGNESGSNNGIDTGSESGSEQPSGGNTNPDAVSPGASTNPDAVSPDANANPNTGDGTSASANPPAAQQTPIVSRTAQTNVQVAKLKAPKLKCKRKKAKNKLTWSKVQGATGYEVFVKYPGSKKYVKALTKSAKVKSVTHKGLTRKKKYSYKVRAFVEINGQYYYGPFSKVIKAKVK